MRRSRGISSRPWARIALAVKQRDGYTCGDCGKTAARFEVHHRDKNRLETIAWIICGLSVAVVISALIYRLGM